MALDHLGRIGLPTDDDFCDPLRSGQSHLSEGKLMPGMAAKVVITERQQSVLRTMIFSRSCAKGLAHRAEIILLAFEGYQNEDIAKKLNCERHGVGIWRRRWQNCFR